MGKAVGRYYDPVTGTWKPFVLNDPPVHVGPEMPTGDEVIWADTDDPTGNNFASWENVSGKPTTFPPSAHTHAVADVTGLAARLTALERDSGWRELSQSSPGVPGYISGSFAVRRTGSTVWLRLSDLVAADQSTSWSTFPSIIPAGFRADTSGFIYMPMSARASTYTSGPFRTDRFGTVLIYLTQGGKRMDGFCSWPTTDAYPTTPPGTPG